VDADILFELISILLCGMVLMIPLGMMVLATFNIVFLLPERKLDSDRELVERDETEKRRVWVWNRILLCITLVAFDGMVFFGVINEPNSLQEILQARIWSLWWLSLNIAGFYVIVIGWIGGWNTYRKRPWVLRMVIEIVSCMIIFWGAPIITVLLYMLLFGLCRACA
jgi:hypothetical protein